MAFKKHDRRQMRVEKEIQQSLAQFFLRDLQLEEDGLVSVTRVQVPRDLKSAQVFIHQLGKDPSSTENLMKKLEQRAALAQRHIAQDLQLRFCPKIEFRYDKGFEKTLAVDKLLYDMTQAGAFKTAPTDGE